MIYPWQQVSWQQLEQNWSQLAQAYLITGKAYTGKLAFAKHFAQALLCEQKKEHIEPCGTCPSCHLWQQGSHPDFCSVGIENEEAGDKNSKKLAQIKVDAIRQVIDFVHLSSHRGQRRVVLIQPAEAMNTQAANALLKVLEEPPSSVYFLLLADQKDRLLPTIKSRCRQLALAAPSFDAALQYLQETGVNNAENLLAFHSGAPLFDTEPEQETMRENMIAALAQPRLLWVLEFAQQFDQKKWPLALFLDWMNKWLMDILLVQQQLVPQFYPQQRQALHQIANKIDAIAVFALVDKLKKLQPFGYHTLSVKLQLEALLLDYLKLLTQKRRTENHAKKT